MGKINISNSEYYIWGDKCEGWHFLKRDDASVIREKMPPGTSEQMHLHEKSRQFFYILKGNASFIIQGEEIIVGPGEGIEIEPTKPHQIINYGPDSLEFILFSYPPTREDRVNL